VRIISYTRELEYDDFVTDFKTQDAVIRNIEILGEAVKLLSANIKENNPGIPLKNIAGTRDKRIHDYFGVNIDIICIIATTEIPHLSLLITDIVERMEDKSDL